MVGSLRGTEETLDILSHARGSRPCPPVLPAPARRCAAALLLAPLLLAPALAQATRTLEAGLAHNLAVTATGQVVAWGENTYGALGNGTRAHSSTPVRAGTLTGVIAVSAGGSLSLALRSDGTVWAWGGGEAIRPVGVDTCFSQPCSLVPRQVPGLSGVRAIAASGSGDFALALLADGTVRAWGSNLYARLGIGNETDSFSPATVPITGVSAIAAGLRHGVALKGDGTVWTWGSHEFGELGAPLASAPANTCNLFGTILPCSKTPIQVGTTAGRVPVFSALTGITAIASKGRHTLALKSDGSLQAWGYNYYGQLGDGAVADRGAPIAVPGMTSVRHFAAGHSYSVAVKQDGTYWAWGLNLSGQLGLTGLTLVENCNARLIGGLVSTYQLGSTWACKTSPVPSSGRNGATAVVGGGAHTLAVRADGTLDAFGHNSYGQTGQLAVFRFVSTQCYADPGSCRGSPQGATATGLSLGRPSGTGALNASAIGEGLAFGSLAVGARSSALEVRIVNLGGPFRVTAIAASGDFQQSSSCVGTTLPETGTCSILVTFQPSTVGDRTGALTVDTDLREGSRATLALSGTGTGFTLTTTRGGTGTGRITSSPAGIDCGTTCTAGYAANTNVTLTAAPGGGSTFSGWSGACAGTGACTVTMTGDRAVNANFTAATQALTVTRAGSGQGTVTSSPAGINCGTACNASFPAGSTVTLSASAQAGSTFAGWSGACLGSGACTVTMSAARAVTATFAAAGVTLSVTRAGTGEGTVTSSPSGIDCGATCLASFAAGTRVTLTATPAAGSVFNGWGGSCSGTATCVLTLNAAASAVAEFRASAAPATLNYTSMWWNPAEPGWGINLNHQGDVVFATLFTYDATGRATWLSSTARAQAAGATVFSGDLFRTTGPAFDAVPFVPIGSANFTRVGGLSLAFTSDRTAILDYSVDGTPVQKRIEKQVYGSRAANCLPTTFTRTALANYQDLWWNPDESGWGINVTHQDQILFATLFTYDAAGRDLWLLLSNGPRQADGSYFGELYRATGPRFDAVPFAPFGPSNLTVVGTMRLTFADGATGLLDYTVNGSRVLKSIRRQEFASPRPACG